jgi:alpha-L-rhamnosidase
MRTTINSDPFLPLNMHKNWRERGLWPASWIACPGADTLPLVTAFRRTFTVPNSTAIRIHVTADERYHLFLDGVRIGLGPERGAPDHWFYESYELTLVPGDHILVARTWSLGEQAADAQMSIHPGFLLAAEGMTDLLSTGIAPWEAKILQGYQFIDPPTAPWRGATVKVDGTRFAWGFESGLGDGWQPARKLGPGVGKRIDWELRPLHVLYPATLPPMLDRPFTAGAIRFVGDIPSQDAQPIPIRAVDHLAGEAPAWSALLGGLGSVTIPPHTRRRVIIDLQNYYTAYPQVTLAGGAGSLLRLHWAEALYTTPDPWSATKGNRDEIEGKYFRGQGDTFLSDGTQHTYDTLWWEAGRYIELVVETAAESLSIEGLILQEARYPLEMESAFTASDTSLEQVLPIFVRGLQVCANETYFDCPYYEEMMYSADTRLEALVTYVMSRDDRLPRKAITLFDASRLPSGLTQSRYPCRVMQIIASWTLWWVAMVRDYALWRDDRPFVEGLMPGVRATMEGFRRYYGSDGLLHAPEGWNNFDWVPAWSEEAGCPPDAVSGVSGLLNWHLIYTLSLYADLEAHLGEDLLAERARQHTADLAQRATTAFWDEARGLMADDLSHQHFSEHTQCLVLLSNTDLPTLIDPEKASRIAEGLITADDLARMTVYASFYLFETFRSLGRIEALFERLPLWLNMPDQGFKTPLESPEPSRSDCHGWSTHPLFHYFATILGIRPSSLGFRSVEITPQLGPLTHASGRLVHPTGGEIVVDFKRGADGQIHGNVRVPEGVSAMLVVDNEVIHMNGYKLDF